MSRPSGPKNRCGGQWSEARFNSFIKGMLRQGTRRWAPITSCMREANVSRGIYLCADCKEEVPLTVKDGRKRIKNVFVDHINPIIDPAVGFTTWDECIQRMFCEKDNLQVLCKSCHDDKSIKERAIAAETRKKNNDKS